MAKKSRRKSNNFWFIFLLIVLPLLVWIVSQSTKYQSRAAFQSEIGNQAVHVTKTLNPGTIGGITSPLLLPIDKVTIEGWIWLDDYTSSNVGSRGIFYSYTGNDSGLTPRIQLWVDGGPNIDNGVLVTPKIHMLINANNGETVDLIGQKFSTSAWHHFAIVKNTTSNFGTNTVKLFIDGTLNASVNYSGNPFFLYGTQSSYIGSSWNYMDGQPYGVLDGDVEEIRVSNTAKYTSNFYPSNLPFTSDSSTVALYHLDGDLIDGSANGYTATLHGTSSFVPSGAPIMDDYPHVDSVTGIPDSVTTTEQINSEFIILENDGSQATPAEGCQFSLSVAYPLTPKGYLNYDNSSGKWTKSFTMNLPVGNYNLGVFVSAVPNSLCDTRYNNSAYLWTKPIAVISSDPSPTPPPTPTSTPTPTDSPTPTPIPTPIIVTNSLKTGLVGVTYNQTVQGKQITANAPLTLNIGGLPSGLTMNTCTTAISGGYSVLRCPVRGKPTTAGTYTVTIVLTDALGLTATKQLPLVVN